jgi:hypothetical protein
MSSKKKSSLRNRMLHAAIAHVEGKIAYHRANIEIYLENPAGIGEHPDVMESLVSEMKQIAEYRDILEVAEDIL